MRGQCILTEIEEKKKMLKASFKVRIYYFSLVEMRFYALYI